MNFILENIELDVYLGVPDDERKNKQTVFVSVSFAFDTAKAELSDKIEDSIDYFEIYEAVKGFRGKEFKL
ncbi:MAG: dihydroneopterin aldolase, partial [Candidatus Peregrinibacteria bacterium]|nr:dihydroneopterin aldolase [Candidatus Peregrinibacteria bacterium]